MKCLIILNGELKNGEFLKKLSRECDYIICADGGYRYAMSCGISPDAVMGDFDSCEKPDAENVMVFPAEKDFTDCEIAIQYAIERGFENIILTCALGGRIDHQLANITACVKYGKTVNIMIDEEDTAVLPLTGKINLGNYVGKTFSIIPLETSYITVHGCYYPAENVRVECGETLTISNIAVDSRAYAQAVGNAVLIINKNNIHQKSVF